VRQGPRSQRTFEWGTTTYVVMNHGKIGHSFEINAGVAHMRIPGTLGKVIASASTAATRTPDAGSLLAASMTAGTAALSPSSLVRARVTAWRVN